MMSGGGSKSSSSVQAKLMTKSGILVREMEESDLGPADDYFDKSSDEFLIRMGVDPKLIRGGKSDPERFRKNREIPIVQRPSCGFAFERDGKLIGVSSLKGISFGDKAEIHFHIFDEDLRGKGLVAGFALEFLRHIFQLFDLKILIAEPSVGNEAPNRLLQKLGFKITSTFDAPATGILLARTANRYEIARENLESR